MEVGEEVEVGPGMGLESPAAVGVGVWGWASGYLTGVDCIRVWLGMERMQKLAQPLESLWEVSDMIHIYMNPLESCQIVS